MQVFDAAGRAVATLVDGVRPAGPQSVTWRGEDGSGRPVAAGIYLYRLEAAGKVLTRSMTLVK